MRLLASATIAPASLLLYRRRRREVILTADGQPRIMSETLTTIEANVSAPAARVARRAGGWLKHRLDLVRLGAVAVAVAVQVIGEDAVAWVVGGLL